MSTKTFAEINLNNLVHNINAIKEKVAPSKIPNCGLSSSRVKVTARHSGRSVNKLLPLCYCNGLATGNWQLATGEVSPAARFFYIGIDRISRLLYAKRFSEILLAEIENFFHATISTTPDPAKCYSFHISS